jgi:hypothetical protein
MSFSFHSQGTHSFSRGLIDSNRPFVRWRSRPLYAKDQNRGMETVVPSDECQIAVRKSIALSWVFSALCQDPTRLSVISSNTILDTFESRSSSTTACKMNPPTMVLLKYHSMRYYASFSYTVCLLLYQHSCDEVRIILSIAESSSSTDL